MIKAKILPISRLHNFKEFDQHQAVYELTEHKSGLNGFISIHSTANSGIAIGGTRYFVYASEDDAIRDALNLSRAMTYKCAITGINLGGGKAVLMAGGKGKSPVMMDSYARAVNSLNGLFRTGEDVGINESDVIKMGEVSKYILGLPGAGGDPSPWAALSVFRSIEAALEKVFDSEVVNGRTFAVKGVGKVGAELVRLLYDCGGEITIADIDSNRTTELSKKYPGVKIALPEDIHKMNVDLYAPCAMGGEFNVETANELNCKIVCGSANNQLAYKGIGKLMYNRGIIYVPDYLANAGGLINVADELDTGGYNNGRVKNNVLGIRDIVKRVLVNSTKEGRPTNEISDKFAEDLLKARMK
ncbi:MAG: leucine dehydrogenase [Candidatus Vogelbacteria bacterium]|nr:leucine dehydrogenase [Candidatus Vogelbacteria bacterium]